MALTKKKGTILVVSDATPKYYWVYCNLPPYSDLNNRSLGNVMCVLQRELMSLYSR